MEAFSRQVRALQSLRTELIVQAQDGPEIMAFERVLAAAHGAALALSADLSTSETLHWADRALNFKSAAIIDATWESTEYTPLNPRHPIWDDPALQENLVYPVNDPLWTHLAAGYLLALGFPRSPKVQREIRQARLRNAERSGAAFYRLPPAWRNHQSRLLPGMASAQTLLSYQECRVHFSQETSEADEHTTSPSFTPVLALYREGDQPDILVSLLAWTVSGQAHPLAPGEGAAEMLGRLQGAPGQWLDVHGLPGVQVEQAIAADLLRHLPEKTPDPEGTPAQEEK